MSAVATRFERPTRILIVDDDPENREVLEIILAWEGFVTVSAAGGREALATTALDPPDLVLLDVMMPGMDGYQVAAELKKSPATRPIPIMMLTALRGDDVRARCLHAGAVDVLTKPMDRSEVMLRVRRVLQQHKALSDVETRGG